MTTVTSDPSAAFTDAAEPFRRELLAHCYRMLGSVHEAEDAVQETYLRAWRAYDRFEGRSTLRTWLYRIATNTCLTALEGARRRALPSGLGPPTDDVATPTRPADPNTRWLQPLPDALVDPASEDPAVIVAHRESVRLALVAGLQFLPPRQRAVLLLRDVMAWSAPEVAEAMGITQPAVKSLLARARTRLTEVDPNHAEEPSESDAQHLLNEYVAAFQNADPARLARVLRKDTALEYMPFENWYRGYETCLASATAGMNTKDQWRMTPTRANGTRAVGAYLLGDDGRHHAAGIVVLTLSNTGIARITVFGDPTLFPTFGLPDQAV